MESNNHWSLFGAVGAAIAASACCTIPLALVSLGAGGAWVSSLSAFEPFRPYFIGAALLLLGYAGFREYKRSTDADCDCDSRMEKTTRRSLLAVGALITIGLVASPTILSSASSSQQITSTSSGNSLETITLHVSGMTCETCNITVAKALEGVDGVRSAVVTFVPPEAVVVYDASVVSVTDLTAATGNVGYPSKTKLQDGTP